MRRRAFIAALGGAAVWPLGASAQHAGGPAAKLARLGILSPGPSSHSEAIEPPFTAGLRALGYVEGQNLIVERRHGDWRLDRLPALAAELVALKVDTIIAWSTPTALAAKDA